MACVLQKAIASLLMHVLSGFAIVWQKPSDAVSVAQHWGAVTVTLARSTAKPEAFMTFPIGGEPQVTLAAASWSVIVCISVKLLHPAVSAGVGPTVVVWTAQYSGLIRLQKSRTALVLEKIPVGQVPHCGPHCVARVKPA
jgi:hypothetical protein